MKKNERKVRASVSDDPVLLAEWDQLRNEGLSPESISKWSRSERVWWICEKGHSWQTFPVSRSSSGSGCPYCKGRKATAENSLASRFPEIAKSFHPTKNGDVTPDQLTPFSNAMMWWSCEKAHEWQTRVSYRSQGSGCPYCWKHTSKPEKRILAELESVFDRIERRYQNLGKEADLFLPSIGVAIEYDGAYWHRSIRQRDEEKNQLFESHDIRLIRVREAPLTKLRECDIIYDERVLPKRVIDEILCAVRSLCSDEEKQLIAHYLESDQFLRESQYQQYVSELSAIRDDDRLDLCEPELLKEWNTSRNGNLSPADFSYGSDHKVWWTCSRGHEWEARIGSRTINKTGCPVCSGNEVDRSASFAILYPDIAAQWDPVKNGQNTPDQFGPKSGYKAWWICDENHVYQAAISSRTGQKSGCNICSGRKVIPETSLKSVRPSLLRFWDFGKNSIQPDEISPKSSRSVFWKCDQGHFWELPPCNFRDETCPQCKKRANSVAGMFPEIAKEWHTNKNENVSPWDVSRGTRTKYWWRCQYGHEWSASPNVRTRTNNPLSCPECKRLDKIKIKKNNQE